jgi:hypothetical protein
VIASIVVDSGRISQHAPALKSLRMLRGAVIVAAHHRWMSVTGAAPVTQTPSWSERSPRRA